MSSFTLTVPGVPAPQGSKTHKGRGVMVESCKRTEPWRTDVKFVAERALRSVQWRAKMPMQVEATFVFKRPNDQHVSNDPARELKASALKYPAKRIGDLDKLCRAICDALTGVAYDDDCQVVSLIAHRRYANPDQRPCAIITVTILE